MRARRSRRHGRACTEWLPRPAVRLMVISPKRVTGRATHRVCIPFRFSSEHASSAGDAKILPRLLMQSVQRLHKSGSRGRLTVWIAGGSQVLPQQAVHFVCRFNCGRSPQQGHRLEGQRAPLLCVFHLRQGLLPELLVPFIPWEPCPFRARRAGKQRGDADSGGQRSRRRAPPGRSRWGL